MRGAGVDQQMDGVLIEHPPICKLAPSREANGAHGLRANPNDLVDRGGVVVTRRVVATVATDQDRAAVRRGGADRHQQVDELVTLGKHIDIELIEMGRKFDSFPAEELGIEILNCSPYSKLRFRNVEIEEALS